MFKKSLLIMLLLAIFAPWAAKAQQTVLSENFNNMSSFATTFSATGWYAYNAGSGNNWTVQSGGTSNSKCARYTYDSNNAANCYLVSAPFTVSTSFDELGVSLQEKVESSSYAETFEVFFVKASEVTDLASVATATQYSAIASASYTNTYYAEQNGSTTNQALAGQSVRVVVHCTSAKDRYYLYIDDIIVTVTSTAPYISLNATSATIFTGYSETLTATYGNVTDPTINYTSSNTSVATVSGSGTTATVTAVAPGTATITATMNGLYTATCDVTVEDPHHCTPTFTGSHTSYYISKFETTGAYSNIINSTTGTGLAYSDYYDTQSAIASEGQTINFTITIAGGSSYGAAIWVDWNNDYEFSSGERVYQTTGWTSTPSGSFTVPAGTSLGDHRMRVVADYSKSTPSDPCSGVDGEFEDYKLTIIEVPDCLPVTALTVDEPNVTATEIPISWTAGGTETSWNIRWRKFGTSDTYLTQTVNTTSFTIPGLTALTKYEFGVQAGCDEDDIWVDGSFTTACPDYFETPFTQDFNSLTSTMGIPQCWNNDEGTMTVTSYKWNYNSYGHSGACVMFNSCYYYGKDNYLKTPIISLPSGQDMQLSFWYRNGSSSNQFKVYIATEDDNYATKTALTESLNGKSDWTEHAPIDLSAYSGKNVMLLFYGKSDAGSYNIYLDDIILRAAPDCATPEGLAKTYNSETPEGATITWTAGDATSWIVEYKKSTEEDYTAITPAVNEPTYTFTGLDYSTTYNARVKVNCTAGSGITYPTDPVSFTTKVQYPAPTNFQTSNLTHNSATVSWTPGYTNQSAYKVQYKKNSDEWTAALEETVANPTIDLPDLTENTTYNVRIYGGIGENFSTDYLSGSFITKNPCAAPTALVISNLTDQSVTLSWTPGYQETSWTVKYKKSTVTSWDDPLVVTETVNTDPTINISGLTGGTIYNVQVINCESALSDNFTTAYSSPFEEKFAANSIPTAWNNYSMLLSDDVLNGTTPLSGSGGSWIFNSRQNVFGNFHGVLNIFGTSCRSWLVTPNITVGTGYSLGFDLALTDYNSTSAIEFPEGQADDKFIVLISEDNGTTWTILRQWNNTGSEYVYNEIAPGGETVYIDLTAYSGKTVRVAFYGESTVAVTGEDNDLHIDNVSIDVTPTCYKPGKPAASNVTNHSATLTWTAGEEGQTAWQIAYKKGENFDPNATGFDLSTVDVVDVEALTYTFDKTLDAASTYYMYVRAHCDIEYSKWCTNACSFTTKEATPKPTYLTTTNVTPRSVDLGWTVGGGDFETSWDIYYVDSYSAPTTTTEPTISGVTDNPHTITGLTDNKTYYFWVRANHSDVGPSDWSSYTSQAIPEACPKPTALTASDPTPNSIKLSWTAGATWQTAWTVAYSETNNFDPTDVTACKYVDADTNVFVVDELDNNKTYYFRVKGNCGSEYGESAWNSYQVSAKTLVACPKPTNLAASNLTLNTADLTWTGYSDSYTVQIREGIPTYLSEDFENGMPANWDNSVYSSSSYVWQVGSGSGNGYSNGTQNAYFYPNTSSSFVTAYLITPPMNLGASAGATLSFSYVNAVWSGGQDELYVYYRVDNGVWTLLGSYTDNQSSWTDVTITLEGLADNYQIGFYGTNMVKTTTYGTSYDYGYGIGIDNVKVYETEAEVGIWNTATTEATDGAYTLTGLTAGVTYDVQIEGNCEGAVLSDVLSFTLPEFLAKKIIAHDSQDGGSGWYLIASPIAGEIAPTTIEDMIVTDDVTTSEIDESKYFDLYRFNQAEELEWENYKTDAHNTDTDPFMLVSGQGYLYANAETVTLKFTGTPYSGDGKVTLSYSDDNPDTKMHGWNLIGNPLSLPASIGTKPYYRVNYTVNDDGDLVGGNELEAGTGNIINPMEGIFVHADSNNEEVTFSLATTSAPSVPMVAINILQEAQRGASKTIDRAIVRFGENGTLPKFQLNPNHTKVYIPQDGKDYAVVGAGSVGELPVNFMAENNGTYTLSLSSENVEFSYLHLIDNMTGKDIDLLQAPSYSFNAKTTDYESRFRLVFATGSSVDGESFGFFNGNGNFSVIGIEGTATLQVLDVMGRMLSSETFSGSIETKVSDVPGVYMLRLINGNDVKVQKVIVK